jgi:hypothetical protein
MSHREQINDVLSRYCYGYDANELKMTEACFAEDATMTLRIQDGDLIGPFEGRDAIMKLMSDSLESQNDQRRHLTTNVFFDDETDDGATVTSYLTLTSVVGTELTVLATGVYTDKFVRQGGDWVISERFLQLDAPY